jgi:hypothetical protein
MAIDPVCPHDGLVRALARAPRAYAVRVRAPRAYADRASVDEGSTHDESRPWGTAIERYTVSREGRPVAPTELRATESGVILVRARARARARAACVCGLRESAVVRMRSQGVSLRTLRRA